MTVGKDTIELGGSIYHVKNIIVDGLVRKFGLQTRVRVSALHFSLLHRDSFLIP
jgi:hypothetical protein